MSPAVTTTSTTTTTTNKHHHHQKGITTTTTSSNVFNKKIDFTLSSLIALVGVLSLLGCISQSLTSVHAISFIARSISSVCCLLVGLLGMGSCLIKSSFCYAKFVLCVSYVIGLSVLLLGQLVRLLINVRLIGRTVVDQNGLLQSSVSTTFLSPILLSRLTMDSLSVFCVVVCLSSALRQLSKTRTRRVRDSEDKITTLVYNVDFSSF